jgi:gliding motility-associated-like protein
MFYLKRILNYIFYNTCTSSVTASLTTNSLPNPSLSISPKTKNCLNSQFSFEGFGGLKYDWIGPGNLSYSGKVITFTASNLTYEGTYTLIVSDINACRNYTLASIQIDPLPKGNLSGTYVDACVPFSSDFNFISDGNFGSQIKAEWSINSIVSKSGNKFSYDFKIPGEYTIVGNLIDTATSCKNVMTFTVQALELPKANFIFTPENPVENMDEVLFSNTSTGNELSRSNWYFISNEGYQSSQNSITYLFPDAGHYPVVLLVKNKWNCSDTIGKNIKVETDFNVYVPNAFTPNNDNLNEVFKPVVRGTTHYELSVYNRWGEQLFLTHDTSEGWDGNYADKPCKSDLYVWKVILTSNNGEQKAYKGHVTLYR